MGKIIYVSRSAIVARKNCPRLRFLRYHAPMLRGQQNLGYQRRKAALPLLNGIQIHESLAQILLNGADVLEDVIRTQRKTYEENAWSRGIQNIEEEDFDFLVKEQQALLEGLIRGWTIVRLPMLLEEYRVLSVEQSFPYEIVPGLIQQVRLDGVLERRDDDAVMVQEFKTVSHPGYSWANSWHRNTQMLANTQALEQNLERRVEGVIIEGLVKGTRRNDTAVSSKFFGKRIQNSPFCYGYSNGHDFQTEYTSRKGWHKIASWEHMPMKQWVEDVMDPNLLQEQFIVQPPIKPVPRHMDRWRRQTVAEELEFAQRLEEYEALDTDDEREQMLDVLFPQNEEHCNKYGEGSCEMDEICWTEGIAEDPIGSGLYEEREPHHPVEEEKEAA
jgi:hypothetical protein